MMEEIVFQLEILNFKENLKKLINLIIKKELNIN